jgi:peroxiredoxin
MLAGTTKLRDRAETRRALESFGVPRILLTPGAVLLPVTELALGFALLTASSAWLAAIVALALLLAFTAVILISLARGHQPECHCFGSLSSGPIRWSTVARNIVLAFVAGFILWNGRLNTGPSAWVWLANLDAEEAITLISATTTILLLVGLRTMLRQHGRVLLRLEALEKRLEDREGLPGKVPVGTAAPSFRVPSLTGKMVGLEDLLALHKPVLLVFTNPRCGPCRTLMPELSQWQREHSKAVTIVVVSEGSRQDNRAEATRYRLTHVLIQEKHEVGDAYRVHGTPVAVLVQANGNMLDPSAHGADDIRELMRRALRLQATRPEIAGEAEVRRSDNATNGQRSSFVAKRGDPAPPFELQDTGGTTLSLASFRGIETLLLFFNPRCGFCQQMVAALRAWETEPPFGAPELLIVSTGSAEENLALGLRSTVAIDPAWKTAAAFGVNGTPMAILIDAEGRISSDLAAGSAAVLALCSPDRQLPDLLPAR